MELLPIIIILTLVASFVGTVSGFGSSTVMIPVLLFFFPYAEAIFLAAIIHFFNDLWKITLFREGVKWRLILTFGIPAVIATYFGATFVFTAPELLLSRILGGFFIAYAIFLLVHKKFKVQKSDTTAVIGGALSGFFAGIFGLGGAIRSAFLAAYNLPKSVYIATIGMIALVTDGVRIATYQAQGVQLENLILFGLLLFIPASFLGAKAARDVLTKVPQQQFRLVVAIFLLLVGLKFLFLP